MEILAGIIGFIILILFIVTMMRIGKINDNVESLSLNISKIIPVLEGMARAKGYGKNYQCPKCKKNYEGKQDNCPFCKEKMIYYNYIYCPKCKKPIEEIYQDVCPKCKYKFGTPDNLEENIFVNKAKFHIR